MPMRSLFILDWKEAFCFILIEQKLGQVFLMLQIQEEPFDVDDVYNIYSVYDNIKKVVLRW